jgi:large exoprotein involved in heme utilization and adhesion
VALDSTGALSIAPSVPRGLVEITRSDLTAVDFSGAPGGAISIVGGRLVMNGGTARVETVAADPGLQPGIRLQATEDVVLVNGASVGSVSQGDAAGGDVEVSGRNVIVDDGSVIFSQAFGLGRGGDVRVTASGEIVVSGRDAFEIPSAIGSDASGDVSLGGNVFVSAPTVTIEDGGLIRTNISASSGRGGDVIVEAGRLTITGDAGIVSIAASFLDVIRGGDLRVTADSITLSGGPLTRIASSASPAVPPPPGEFAAGDIVMRAGTISVQGGAQIQSGNFAEDAGNLTLEARDSIVISGGSRVSGQAFATTGGPVRISTPLLTVDDALIDTSTLGIGDAANISIAVGRLNLTNGGKIISSGLGDSTGRGGSIHVTANDVSISGASQTGLATTDFIADPRSGLFSETAGSGAGGDVFVNASNVTVQTGGAISARSTGTGNAGDIGLVIGNQLSVIGGVITTAATQADGGNISITTTGSVVHLSGGQITTSVQSGEGSGGNITIGSAGHPVEFVVLNDSQIRADAFGGPGGNVSISAGTFLTQGSVVSASSALSVPGTISIEAEVTDVSGSVGQLPEALFQASTLLRAACATRMAGGQSSSLVVSGREGIPAEPGSPLSSSLIAEGAVDPARADTNPSMPMWAFEPRCLR